MAYCTATDVKTIKSIARLLNVNGGTWTDDNITALITEIDAVIDERLEYIYDDLPISPVPPTLTRISKLKTAYDMLLQEYGQDNENWKPMFDEAESLMKQILNGTIKLADPDTETPHTGAPIAVVADTTRYFSMEE